MEKRYLETMMTKDAALDFGLNLNDLIRVRRGNETFYVYREEVDKEIYDEINREDWKYQKRRQRMFEYMAEQNEVLISLDASKENLDFEIKSDFDLEEEAIKHLMLEAMEKEIDELPDGDRKLMKLVLSTDLTQRQLAEIFDVSQGTIFWRIKKNKKILREKLIK